MNVEQTIYIVACCRNGGLQTAFRVLLRMPSMASPTLILLHAQGRSIQQQFTAHKQVYLRYHDEPLPSTVRAMSVLLLSRDTLGHGYLHIEMVQHDFKRSHMDIYIYIYIYICVIYPLVESSVGIKELEYKRNLIVLGAEHTQELHGWALLHTRNSHIRSTR